MQLPIFRTPFRDAIAAVLGNTAPDPLQQSRGDLREATARRLGVPVLDRTRNAPHPDAVLRLVANRADRRAARHELTREARLDTYARRLTRKVPAA